MIQNVDKRKTDWSSCIIETDIGSSCRAKCLLCKQEDLNSDSQHLCQEPDTEVHTHNPKSREAEGGGLIANQIIQIRELQVQRNLVSKSKVKNNWGRHSKLILL